MIWNWVRLILTAVMFFALVACGGTDTQAEPVFTPIPSLTPSAESTSTPEPTNTPLPPATPTPTPTLEPTATASPVPTATASPTPQIGETRVNPETGVEEFFNKNGEWRKYVEVISRDEVLNEKTKLFEFNEGLQDGDVTWVLGKIVTLEEVSDLPNVVISVYGDESAMNQAEETGRVSIKEISINQEFEEEVGVKPNVAVVTDIWVGRYVSDMRQKSKDLKPEDLTAEGFLEWIKSDAARNWSVDMTCSDGYEQIHKSRVNQRVDVDTELIMIFSNLKGEEKWASIADQTCNERKGFFATTMIPGRKADLEMNHGEWLDIALLAEGYSDIFFSHAVTIYPEYGFEPMGIGGFDSRFDERYRQLQSYDRSFGAPWISTYEYGQE